MDNPNKANEFLAKKAKKINEAVTMHNLVRSFVQLQVNAEPKPNVSNDKPNDYNPKR